MTAANTSDIDATLDSSTSTGDKVVGVTLAFNTLGWEAQNVLFGAIDALLGTNIGDEQPASVTASITESTLEVTGDLTVRAESAAQLNATASNAAISAASALYGASGAATSGLLTSNMVSSTAKAFIKDATGTVRAGGTLTVAATDTAGIYANIKLVSSSTTTNDGGVGVFNKSMRNLAGVVLADFMSGDGEQTIAFGDRVQVASDYENGGDGEYLYT
ncbi:MAG: parallel beta-helix repeat-containing protein [Rhodospirillaceae bacterium]|nr:MAG: parallel beta-helix repeat-containing protein [Rhodospirillaceae bacterium]